jgi:hypothetical protein
MSDDYMAAVKSAAEQAEILHERIADLIERRVRAVAIKISGAPVSAVRNMLMARCNGCACGVIKKIATGEDGF